MRSIFVFLAFCLLFSTTVFAQNAKITVSGQVKETGSNNPLAFVNVTLHQVGDRSFVTGGVTMENGDFTLKEITSGEYVLKLSFIGYENLEQRIQVGRLSPFLDLGTFFLAESISTLDEVEISSIRETMSAGLDRMTFGTEENLSQLGGSALQVMQNLPGITVDQEGKIFVRGSDKVAVLLDGKQTALTGFGLQTGLDNIPASAIEKIEIIHNPSSKYDANGMAGIINIVFKKSEAYGWNGKIGLIGGVGALWERRTNLGNIRDQYSLTPKINPSASFNYRKKDLNWFFQGDLLLHQRLNKNEFITTTFDDGRVQEQQFLENRTQPIYNIKTGLDWKVNEQNSFTFSALYNVRAYVDLGDLPYFNAVTNEATRLWQYYEEEVNTTFMTSLNYKHQFSQPGHQLEAMANYSFRRKDEVFYFENFQAGLLGTDTTMLIADEHVVDITLDYVKPLRAGRVELGGKFRNRYFPNLITFLPGTNSILDTGLDGTATYQELISAMYGNYIYESRNWELEGGLRLEYADINYLVDPNHTTYSSDGFDYFQLFPNVRWSYLFSKKSQLSLFYNRRVDRPEESMLRVFPQYDDPVILKIGNPTLLPQFTQSLEAGYKYSWKKGSLYTAAYHRMTQNIITRILTPVEGTNRLVSIFQNADRGSNTGIELVLDQQLSSAWRINFNANGYRNVIQDFSITNAYPNDTQFSRGVESLISGNAKANLRWKSGKIGEWQLTGIYLARDLIPQGTIAARYSVDLGWKKAIQGGKGELLLTGSDIFNTLVIRQEIRGADFTLISSDFYETQAFRVGYSYRF